MDNPFQESATAHSADESLAKQVQEGSRQALERLVKRHQGWIYNIAVRIVWYAHDAEDVTQEILIKMITRISTFRGESRFRTWLYRILTNHVIDMKRRRAEESELTFPAYEKMLVEVEDRSIPDETAAGVEKSLLVEEAKIGCTVGMLLCLDRRQRLVFILGEVFGVPAKVAADIMEMSQANFRQVLSRARRNLYNFIQDQCGHINDHGRCHCHRKAWAFIEDGTVEPANLRFAPEHLRSARDVALASYETLEDTAQQQCATMFSDHPFVDPPDATCMLEQILSREDLQSAMHLQE